MKTLNHILFALLMFASFSFLGSCTDEDNMELNKGEQGFVLSSSEKNVELDITSPDSEALKFSWTPGSNQGTNSAITYLFEVDIAGNNFANAKELELDKGTTSVAYTTEQLNLLLVDYLASTPGQAVEIEARVTASVHSANLAPVTTDVVKVTVTTYKPVSKTLYLIGDATPNGWSADGATALNSVSGAAGGFTWQGKLTPGKFKLITTLGEFTPSYNKGADDTKLYFRESSDDPYDEQFEITKGGVYRVTLNIINLAIHIEALNSPEYDRLWFVGNPSGWNFKELTVDALDPFVFHYNADLTAGGEFKIATLNDFDDSVVFFRPAIDGQGAGTDLNVVKWSKNENANDYKWNIAGGVYKIALNTQTMKIDIVPFTPYSMIYLVGDASPNGWSIDNATPMAAVGGNPYKFEWSGTLNAGEFKFTCDKQSDWNGDWFLATVQGQTPSGQEEQVLFSAAGANPDNKWRIEQSGTYAIEFDQLRQTVKITKQ